MRSNAMSEETRRILEMLAQGKITVDEADKLLRALDAASGSASTAPPPQADGAASDKPKPRFVRINVKRNMGCGPHRDVTIRVPLGFVRSGMRLGACIPGLASERAAARMREHGVDFDFSKLDSKS